MQKLFRFIFTFSILSLAVACNKEQKIFGVVKDQITGKGIPKVTVSYSGYQKGKVITDVNGAFTIETSYGKRSGLTQLFITSEDNPEISLDYFIPTQQLKQAQAGSGNAIELFLHEIIEGNLIIKDQTPSGEQYDFLEYFIYSKELQNEMDVNIRRRAPFVSNQLVSEEFFRGTLYIHGKLHYLNGTVEQFTDSVFVPKSVANSFTWNVNF